MGTCDRRARPRVLGSGRHVMTGVRLHSERVNQALLLAAVGGFLDAYTFVGHGGVFANAQTGNIVIFGADAATHRWHSAVLHLPAIAAFLLGVAVTELLALPRVRDLVKRPTRVVLISEILVLAILGALPTAGSTVLVTAAVAFVASLQVSTFRKVGDTPYSSTLTTANLRNLVSGVFALLAEHKGAAGHDMLRLGGVISAFAAGAALGALTTRHLGAEASWLPAAALIAVLALISSDTNRGPRSTGSDQPEDQAPPRGGSA
jgi:uncharacterized membrane protein YoaK (UPF0700 family)